MKFITLKARVLWLGKTAKSIFIFILFLFLFIFNFSRSDTQKS